MKEKVEGFAESDLIVLPNGRKTTRIGFGCAYLLPETASLVDVAFDAGIRHFDVAPSYGRGLTESILGESLKSRIETTSVTTKFGISPAFRHAGPAQFARAVLRPIVFRIPFLRAYVSSKVAARTGRVPLNAEGAKASIERSLRALKRNHLDLFLLHEATIHDLANPDLLPFLTSYVERGIIGSFGIGGQRANADAILDRLPGFTGVLQFEWSAINKDPIPKNLPFSIFYHATAPAKSILFLALKNRIDLRKLSKSVGLDLSEPTILEQLLLRLSIDMNPKSIVLFSSTREDHIRQNAKVSSDMSLVEPAARLGTLLAAQLA
jgi:diketogulonate reductase-like aldo/keto reductase